MANISEWAANGLYAIQIAARGSTGYCAGIGDLDATDTGTNSGMRRVRGAITAPSPLPGVNRSRNRGDNGYVATFNYDAEPNDFDIEFGMNDVVAENFMTRASLYTLGEWDMAVRGASNIKSRDIVTLLTREAQNEESGGSGNGFENMLIMSTKYRPNPGQAAWQAEGTMLYSGSADRVQTLPWGVPVATAATLTDGITFVWYSEYPCTLECFIGNNVLTSVPLSYKPISVAKTKAFDFSDGSALTVSAVDTTDDEADLSAAPASGDIVIVLYETTGL